MSMMLRLYPRAWRDRYEDEMGWLLEARPAGWRDRFDLVLGAADAWLHPPRRSWLPPAAALLGGGLWTLAATTLVLQPAPPDWPFYLVETLPLAITAGASMLVAAIGVALRLGDGGGRLARLVLLLAVGGLAAWVVALAIELGPGLALPVLAAAQTIAMVGMLLVGSRLVLADDEPVGAFLVAGTAAMLAPWTLGWLALGAAWTAIGIVLWADRVARVAPPGLAG